MLEVSILTKPTVHITQQTYHSLIEGLGKGWTKESVGYVSGQQRGADFYVNSAHTIPPKVLHDQVNTSVI